MTLWSIVQLRFASALTTMPPLQLKLKGIIQLKMLIQGLWGPYSKTIVFQK
jgi:hypothetical protein